MLVLVQQKVNRDVHNILHFKSVKITFNETMSKLICLNSKQNYNFLKNYGYDLDIRSDHIHHREFVFAHDVS